MGSKTVHRKTVANAERAVALAAIATAKLKHKHVGICPTSEQQTERKTAGIRVAPGGGPGTGLDRAVVEAGEAWPDNNSWAVFGADGFEDFPDDGSCGEVIGDGVFEDPCLYGEFGTVDEPGFLGGYPF